MNGDYDEILGALEDALYDLEGEDEDEDDVGEDEDEDDVGQRGRQRGGRGGRGGRRGKKSKGGMKGRKRGGRRPKAGRRGDDIERVFLPMDSFTFTAASVQQNVFEVRPNEDCKPDRPLITRLQDATAIAAGKDVNVSDIQVGRTSQFGAAGIAPILAFAHDATAARMKGTICKAGTQITATVATTAALAAVETILVDAGMWVYAAA